MNKDLSKYKPLFSKNDLKKDKKYKKLNEDDKKKLETLFLNNSYSNAIFKCKNCGYIKKILETISLYKLDNNKERIINTIEDNKIYIKDNTLPRTKQYKCKNIDCLTHKDKSNIEAVFYRDTNSFRLNYICTVCNYSWKI